MTATCPSGHASEADDYCDVCGMPIGESAAAPAATTGTGSTSAAATEPCPNCSFAHLPEALFCEACGYDFTTGTMPRTAGSTAAPAETAGSGGGSGAEWVVEVWIDPDWYEAQESPDPMPSPGLPEVIPLHATSVLIGRSSKSRNISPDIACEEDTGISRRQAQLTTDGTRWWVEDLDSSNGTFTGPASGPLPEDPIPVGQKIELKPDDRVYLGAWTRLVVRKATDEEK